MTPSMDEIREKERRVRELMDREGLDAVALSTTANFAWFTCGCSNYVGTASEAGAATIVVSRDGKHVLTDCIEAPRIADEEIAGQGFELVSWPWYEDRRESAIREAAGGSRIGSDVPMEGAVSVAGAMEACRRRLTTEEMARYREVGRMTGECISEASRGIRPGMSEHEIAALMNGLILARGMVPVTTLVAVDERIRSYRHPLPTDKKLAKHAMLVTGAKKWGLVVSMTRLVHFGPLSPELRVKHEAVTRVDAAFIIGTTVGARMGDIFARALEVYRETGFAGEWELHHQGGPTGYRPREGRVTLGSDAIVEENQAMAWNPSITGTKSEDTIIATPAGPEIISEITEWPMVDVEIGGRTITRPWILVV